MKINLQSLHFTPKNELNEFVDEKVNKLSHFNENIELAEVTLRLEKSETRDNKQCKIRLSIPGNDLFAERQRSTFEEAIVDCVDALHHQMKK